MTISERQQYILRLVIEEFIATAEPVGSQSLTDNKDLNVSAATIRNELRELEDLGFLTHPHTSAGRMPTEQGYRYYVDTLMKSKMPSSSEVEAIARCVAQCRDAEQAQKQIAQYIATSLQDAVIIVRGRERLYYTGLSALFAQREFQDYSYTISVSQIFDHFEQNLEQVYACITGVGPQICIGSQNPLGSTTSLVGTRMGGDDLFLIFGPLRLDYARAVGTINYLTQVLSQ